MGLRRRPRIACTPMPRLRLAAAGACVVVLAAGCPGSGPPPHAAGPPPPAAGRGCPDLHDLVTRTVRGYYPVRSPDLAPIPYAPNYVGSAAGPVHTGPWDYLAEVPLVAYGPGIVRPAGRLGRPVTMADVAPTIGGLIGFPFRTPDGRDVSASFVRRGAPKPRLVLTLVWDGAGRDMLRAHAGRWAYLKRLMHEGASFTHMTIGSTPSNTAPIHSTLGTGVFPDRHGIVHVNIRMRSGGYVDPWEGNDPGRLLAPSLADRYDRARGNRPVIGLLATVDWHLGMIGHGAEFPDGDRDLTALLNSSGISYGDPSIYDLSLVGSPGALERESESFDIQDGKADGRWLGSRLSDPNVRYSSPAWVRYQRDVFRALLARQGFGDDAVPDLLFENIKSADDAGHMFGMYSPEVDADIAAMDRSLKQTVHDLNALVGKGRWVVLLTADHGFTPSPRRSGAWPIYGGELKDDLNAAFDHTSNGTDLVLRVNSAGIYLHRHQLQAGHVTERRLARWILGYTARDNLAPGHGPPPRWRGRTDRPLFEAVVGGRRLLASACRRSPGPDTVR